MVYNRLNINLKIMAELNVQPKKRTPWWVWIILLIVALALLYIFLGGGKSLIGSNEPVVTDSTVVDSTVTKTTTLDSVTVDTTEADTTR